MNYTRAYIYDIIDSAMKNNDTEFLFQLCRYTYMNLPTWSDGSQEDTNIDLVMTILTATLPYKQFDSREWLVTWLKRNAESDDLWKGLE